MKLAVDGLILFLNNGQIGNYSKSIIDNLIKYSSINLDIVKDYEIESSNYQDNSVELLLDRRDTDFSNLALFLKASKIDAYHCLNNGFSIPKNFDFNYIMSINNLLPLYHENICSMNYVTKFFSKVPYGVMNSSQVIFPSISTKHDFLNSFSIDESNLYINYGVVSRYYTKIDGFLSSVYIKSKFNIEGEFIIFNGDFSERKNLDKCILFFKNIKKYFGNITFIISSDSFKNKKYLDILINLSENIGVRNDIIYLSQLNTMDKANLFSKAIFFIDLSIYENVNLNIVEAFSCSTPIICSDIDLYREYFGDSVFYYNDNLDYLSILNYVSNYNQRDKMFVLDKFSSDVSLKCSLNSYNKFK